jgi:serine/threonine-protein kinase
VPLATLQTPPRLEILGKLAQGGMGAVWVARVVGDPEHLVALKRMHRHLAKNGEFLSMFLDEIWMTGALRHPNVVSLVGWGVDRDGPYLATELVAGTPLSALHQLAFARGEPLAPELVAWIGAEVARGLHAAHTLLGPDDRPLGIVHRDLTPSNVLVGFDGSVKVNDFGIAKASRKIVETSHGVLKGKVHFMAPEYIRGEPLDGRSDLYSLGVVMFELCTGTKPFASIVQEVELLKTAARAAPPPVAAEASLDDDLARIIDELRANRPVDRIASGQEVARRLDAWIHARGEDAASCRGKLAAFAQRYGSAERAQLDAALREDEPSGERSEVLVVEQTWGTGMQSAASARFDPATAPADSDHTPAGTRALGSPLRKSEPPATPATPSVPPVSAPGLPPSVGRSGARPSLAGTPTGDRLVPPESIDPRSSRPLIAIAAICGVVAVGAAIATLLLPTPPAPPTRAVMSSPPPTAPEETASQTPAASQPTVSAEPPRTAAVPAPHVPPTQPAPKSAPPQPSQRPRACTPADFDYPNCR